MNKINCEIKNIAIKVKGIIWEIREVCKQNKKLQMKSARNSFLPVGCHVILGSGNNVAAGRTKHRSIHREYTNAMLCGSRSNGSDANGCDLTAVPMREKTDEEHVWTINSDQITLSGQLYKM